MGIFNGKYFKGKFGKTVFKTRKDGKLITQSLPEHVRQTEGSQKTASIMGNASTLSKGIRLSMTSLFGDRYPGTMVNKLNTLNRVLLEHCCDKDTQTYSFQQNSFGNLSGFEFNEKSPLANHLWVKPEVSINGTADKISITIPAFEIPSQLKMPNHANACEIYIQMAQFALHGSCKKTAPVQMIVVEENQVQVPETQFSFDIMPGCLGIIGVGIRYYSSHKQIKKPLNNENLNPAAIVGAIFTPGEFIEPMPVTVNGKSSATAWFGMDKLKLPKLADQ